MNQLCNFIDLAPLADIESINGQEVIFKTGKAFDRINSENSPQWTENPSRNDAGTFYTQTLRIVSEKLSQALKLKYPVNRQVIAIMHDDEGSHLLGSTQLPARITTIPNPHTDSLQLSRKATTPIY